MNIVRHAGRKADVFKNSNVQNKSAEADIGQFVL
jgi:hypothetical protein